jgi:hypothetical protein
MPVRNGRTAMAEAGVENGQGVSKAGWGLGRANERDKRRIIRMGGRKCMVGTIKLRRYQSDGDTGA